MPNTTAVRTAQVGAASFFAGKNKIINGDFGVWQRGSSFTPAASAYVFTADRMGVSRDGTGATVTVSRQTFTPGTAPVTGYESQYFFRYAQTVAGTGGTYLTVCSQKIEDVRTFAGQTTTFSFWAKADATRTVNVGYGQVFGSGGSGDVYGSLGSSITLTTSWVRYSVTGTIPSISGKTVGTGSFLELYISGAQNTVQTIDIWGVQLEAGSTATAFQTATGTIQGELAACQRYFQNTEFVSLLHARSTTSVEGSIMFPVTMRVAPTLTATSAWIFYDAFGTGFTQSSANGSLAVSGANTKGAFVSLGNFTGLTQGRTYASNAASQGAFTLSSEL